MSAVAGPSSGLARSTRSTVHDSKQSLRSRASFSASTVDATRPRRASRASVEKAPIPQAQLDLQQEESSRRGHTRRASARSMTSMISIAESVTSVPPRAAGRSMRAGNEAKLSLGPPLEALSIEEKLASPQTLRNSLAASDFAADTTGISTPLSSPELTPIPSAPSTADKPSWKGKERATGQGTTPRQGAGGKPSPSRRQPEKRVLPARIRRAAGGGAEGIRDLEEMIVDWLERHSESCSDPPDNLVLHLTTLPSYLIHPAVLASTTSHQTAAPAAPGTISCTSHDPAASPTVVAGDGPDEASRQRIEVPTWKYVKAKDDDEEEAREEIAVARLARARGIITPVKRLRHGAAKADTIAEDTSDAYYMALHRKYEVFERRQRIREKEKLLFERYKMRSRIDLLRGMSATAWSAVLGVVLSRYTNSASSAPRRLSSGSQALVDKAGASAVDDPWVRGREKLAKEGPDWLKGTLVKEGEEVMKRYDQLLPPDPKRQRAVDSRTPTPRISPSLTPPPVTAVTNHRVAALRDPSASTGRRRGPSPSSRSNRAKLLTGSTKTTRIRLFTSAALPPERSSSRRHTASARPQRATRGRKRKLVHAEPESESEGDQEQESSESDDEGAVTDDEDVDEGDDSELEAEMEGHVSALTRKGRKPRTRRTQPARKSRRIDRGDLKGSQVEEPDSDASSEGMSPPESSQEVYRPKRTTSKSSQRPLERPQTRGANATNHQFASSTTDGRRGTRMSSREDTIHNGVSGPLPVTCSSARSRLADREPHAKIHDPSQVLPGGLIEISPEEAREMREVEAAVL